ncbi:hypothetical protein D9619_009614 [Psilocybe cf. subviscida]|uniref:F-box domain-containing protein n=1 Tax=Psilocybe cf. subviscida TaxID=2480587 RepID=A0A8H5F6T1_9AGAR|nr:hypothetical protein D9619_009614 [Psilocybe cf. subviscida]
MPVRTLTSSNGGHPLIHTTGGVASLSSRSFNLPRIKIAAASLLRHRLPSHQQHNSHVIACNLPREVLRKIFEACAHYSIGGEDPWSWVNISYVCSNWRQAALETPNLWRYIDFSHPRWYAITAVRAKTSSLQVVATVNEGNIRQLYRTLQLAHRIQHVHLVSQVEKITPLLETLAYPNLYLESLILDICVPENVPPHTVIYDPPCFPLNGPPLENLKYMELHCAPFYLLTPRCSSLTELRIHDLPHTERPTLRNFLLVLEQLQHLQFLTLDRSFPVEFQGPDESQALEAPIHLSRLKSLSLTGSLIEVASGLKFLTVPSSTRLICKICSVSDATNYAPKLAANLFAHPWPESNDAGLETMVFTAQEFGHRYTNTFQPNPDFRQSVRVRGFSSSEHGGAIVDFIIHPEEAGVIDDALMTTLDAILTALPIKAVQTLALQDLDIITQKSWPAILNAMPALCVIDIQGRAPSGLAWALLLNAKARPATFSSSSAQRKRRRRTNLQHMLVPKLNDLYLHNVDCSSGGFMVAARAPVNSHCDLDDSRFLDVLVAAITLRRRGDISLRSLCITRCTYVIKGSVQDASKSVSNLVFDCRGVVKEKDEAAIDENFPARYNYASEWGLSPGATLPQVRHYHRLRTLSPLRSKS